MIWTNDLEPLTGSGRDNPRTRKFRNIYVVEGGTRMLELKKIRVGKSQRESRS